MGGEYSIATSGDYWIADDTQAVYSSLGYLKELRDGGGVTLFSVTAKRNDAGQLTNYRYGSSGAATTLQYYVGSGRIKNIQAVAGGYTLQNLGLTYRVDGLVQTRTDITINPTSYGYDELGRLTTEVRTAAALPGGSVTMGWTYDAIGNMTSRSEGGQTDFYQYNGSGAGSVRPHAVANVSGFVNGVLVPRYEYDANGNLLNGAGRTVTWTSYNKASEIVSGANQLSWLYDAEHERAQETLKVNGVVTRTTHYLNPAAGSGLFYEEETTPTEGTLRKHYLTAAGVSIGVVKCAPGGACGAAQAEYWHTDQLGSVSAVSSPSGQLLQTMAYEPFGKRRNASGLTDPNGTLVSPTDRGFTGHEHLDEVGLINMNGRVYDPGLARFLSADTIVQAPGNLQSYNRYSYTWNTPVNGADPSGHCFLGCFWQPKAGAKLFFDAVHNTPGQAAIDRYIMNHQWAYMLANAAASFYGGPAGSAIASAYGTYIATGSMDKAERAGLRTVATAAAFYVVGTVAPGYGTANATWGSIAANTVGHAVVGCVSAEASGGSCRSGAMSAGFSAAYGNYLSGYMGNGIVQQMVVGGTASVIGGGKFSNGAITAAYGYLFNYCAHAADCWADAQRQFTAAMKGVFVDPLVSLSNWISNNPGTSALTIASVTPVGPAIRSGMLVERVFVTAAGKVDFLAETVVVGDRLILNDAVLYGRAEGALTGMTREIYRGMAELRAWAKAEGFTSLEINATRAANSTSANPGSAWRAAWELK